MTEQTALGSWRHPFWYDAGDAEPDTARAYTQRGTGNLEAPCLHCERGGRSVAVIFHPGLERAVP